MHRPVMPATERDRELIADLAAECAGLGEAQVVGIRGLAAAHETCLLGDIAQVLPVAIATRRGDRQHTLVDALRLSRAVLSVVTVTCGSAIRVSEGSSFDNAAASNEGNSDNLRSKASSTSLASAAVRLLLATSASPAQVAARSADACRSA